MDIQDERDARARVPVWSYVPSTFSQSFQKAVPCRENQSKFRLSQLEGLFKEERQTDFHRIWNKIFVLACVVAVLMDPLFFYIPTIKQKDKCVGMDNKLKALAIVFRLLTDLAYIMDIVYYVAKASQDLKREEPSLVWKKGEFLKYALGMARRLSWFHILIDFLAVIPVPQVAILNLFPKVRRESSSSLDSKTFLNVVILLQYVPRIFRIYLSCAEFRKTADVLAGTLWVKGAFNLFLYILASHVVGGFWYFFSIQRETSCWKKACENGSDPCAVSVHNCDENHGLRNNMAFLDASCPINEPNTTIFNFGIFLDALDSGIVESNDFPQKLFYCFWWGLRHLSSLGDNLETSTYVWENCFAVSISIIGLLLFLYLIGNIQLYMQLATSRSEEVKQKMKLKMLDIEAWINKNELPKSWKTVIGKMVQSKLEDQNKDVDVENLLSVLPAADCKSIKLLLCIKILRKVRVFQNMKESVLEDICAHLKPVTYAENSYIIREGHPLDRMLFITQGTVLEFTSSTAYNTNAGSSSNTSNSISNTSNSIIRCSSSVSMKRLRKGDYHGEELLEWSLTHFSFAEFPISTSNAVCHTKVEGFVLKANDLLNAVKRYWWHFRRMNPYSSVSHRQVERWESLAISVIQALWRRKQAKKPINYSKCVYGGNLQQSSNKYHRLRPITRH